MRKSQRPWATAAFCFWALMTLALAAQQPPLPPPTRVVLDGMTHEGTLLGTLVLMEARPAGARYWFVEGDQVVRVDAAGLELRPGVEVRVADIAAGSLDDGAVAVAVARGSNEVTVRREGLSGTLRGLLGEVQLLDNQPTLVPFVRLRTGAGVAAIPAELLAAGR